MLRTLARLVVDRAMILGLVLLCAYFSVATYSEQQPTGESAAQQVAGLVDKSQENATRAVIPVAGGPAGGKGVFLGTPVYRLSVRVLGPRDTQAFFQSTFTAP